jgi:hypothetical protein
MPRFKKRKTPLTEINGIDKKMNFPKRKPLLPKEKLILGNLEDKIGIQIRPGLIVYKRKASLTIIIMKNYGKK